MALALLLRLKRHLKIVYSLNDARCQVRDFLVELILNQYLQKSSSMRYVPRLLYVSTQCVHLVVDIPQ
jgi:hypothetical protein